MAATIILITLIITAIFVYANYIKEEVKKQREKLKEDYSIPGIFGRENGGC